MTPDSSGLRKFEIGLDKFADGVPELVKRRRNALALEGLKGVVMMSPVDEGRLRGGWDVIIGDPDRPVADTPNDKGGGGTIARGQSAIHRAIDAFSLIVIRNGIEYAKHVNDGTTRTAAVHMIERTAARLRRIAKR